MDPLIIHHVIIHPLSRTETNNFQDKSGCSINGIRSFLFEQGIVQNLDDIERLVYNRNLIQDYRGFPISVLNEDFENFPLSDEILRMKNVRFYFDFEPPNHKLVSPEPHFVRDDRNLIEFYLYYLGDDYEEDDIEEWKCFEMDNEGHLVSIISQNLQLSNESIFEHLSNFPHLRTLHFNSLNLYEKITNFGLLSTLRNLSMSFKSKFDDPKLLQDLGLFSNLLSLKLVNNRSCNLD